MGEATSSRAAASVRAQSCQIAQRVVVDGVTPFHRALNHGASQVSTPFVLQVDADMVLDPHCAEVLHSAMEPSVCLAVGALRDPLMGRLAGVKLFRVQCLLAQPMANTVAPDVAFYRSLGARGWQTRCVTGHGGQGVLTPTLGAHRPDYTPDYVFGTYSMLGTRLAHHRDGRGLRWRFEKLRVSSHPMAPAARLALGRGAFVRSIGDEPKPRPESADSRLLAGLVAQRTLVRHDGPDLASLFSLRPGPLFEAFRSLGAELRRAPSGDLLACLDKLREVGHPNWLVAELGLGHGALPVEECQRESTGAILSALAIPGASELLAAGA